MRTPLYEAKNTMASGCTIETLLLVAIWETPFIFQGVFTITCESDANLKQAYVFRAQCLMASFDEILSEEFSSQDYDFTYLADLNTRFNLGEIATAETMEALTYALHITLQTMLKRNNPHLIADELAKEKLYSTVLKILQSTNEATALPAHIGFAVSVPFRASTPAAKSIMQQLLNKQN